MQQKNETHGYAVGVQEFDWIRERQAPYIDKTADEAVGQVVTKDYAVRFAADTRPVWAVGLNISKDRRTIEDYRIVQVK